MKNADDPINANEWNNTQRNLSLPQIGGDGVNVSRGPGGLHIKGRSRPDGVTTEAAHTAMGVNTDTTDLAKYAPCEIVGSYNSGTEAQYKRQIEIKVPTSNAKAKFAVCATDCKAGYAGQIFTSGTCLVAIQTNSGDLYADVSAGNAYLVGSPTAGDAEILWEDGGSSTTTHLALIRFPRGGGKNSNLTAAAATTSTTTTHSGLSAIDGYTPVDGSIILDWNNATPALRGLWVAHAGAWTASDPLVNGGICTVTSGSTYKDAIFICDSSTPTFTQFSAAPVVVAAKAKSTSALTHSGAQTVDGVSCVAGDLVFDSPDVWVVATGTWTKKYAAPLSVCVASGSTNGPAVWIWNGTAYVAACGVFS